MISHPLYHCFSSRSLLLLVILLALSSCEAFFETTIDLPPPEHEPQLVISAFNQSPRLITALVTQSVPLTASPFADNTFLWGATVDVYRNGTYINTMEQVGSADEYVEQYNYQLLLDEALTAGNNYQLEVSYPDLPTASVSTTMPPAPPVQAVDYQPNGGIKPDGNESSAFDILFDDAVSSSAYYEVSAVNTSTGMIENGSRMFLQSTDPSTSRSFEWYRLLISDTSFDGQEKIVRIQTDPLESKEQGSVFITVCSITEAHYNYSKAYRQQFDIEDNPFDSPVQIPTDVEGGFGFFGLRNTSVFEIEF